MGQKYVNALKKRWINFSVFIIGFLFILTIFYSLYNQKLSLDHLIRRDVARISLALKKIDQDADITSFEHVKNHVNFLNVVDFVGSEVGPMNLKKPKGWQGPYMNDNPTMHEQYYLVVNLDGKYYITPGEGVKISSGQRIGKQIHLNNEADISGLASQGLALPFSFK